MNQDNKRKTKQTGLNDQRMNAMKRLKEARNGGRRLDQAIEGGKDSESHNIYGDDDFVVDEQGRACNYDDEEEEEDLGIERKKAKLDPNNIMSFISKMAVSGSNQTNKPKPNLKPKEKTDNFMKNLLEDLDDGVEAQTNSNVNNSNIHIPQNSRAGAFDFSNMAKTRPVGKNPDFLPDFNKKLTNKTNEDVVMQVPYEVSFNSESSIAGRQIINSNQKDLSFSNQSAKRTREEAKEPKNLTNTNGNVQMSNTKSTSDNIFQNRTPVTGNKTLSNIPLGNSGRSEYHTPHSKLPEGRTPIINDSYVTPIKPTFTNDGNSNMQQHSQNMHLPNYNLNQNQAGVYNMTNDLSDSSISMRNSLREKLPTQPDGSLTVYWYDAIEDQIQTKPTVIFFGKVYDPSTKSYASISLTIKNIMRTLYLYPKTKDLFAVYKEFENLRSTKFSYIKDYVSKTVKRKYCFELPIPHGEHEVIKIKYSADMGTVPSNLQGETFDYIFGKNSSLLEKIILNRKLKGPCWLKVKTFEQPTNLRHTFCKYEVILNDFKGMELINESIPNPPLKLLSVSIKTVNNNGTSEIFAISAAMKENYYIENENGTNQVSDFTPLLIMRKYDHALFHKDSQNSINMKMEEYDFFRERYGPNNFLFGQNETAIINQFVNRLHTFDPDVIIGHNLYTGGMELFFNRITKLKINNWAKIGKFRRDVLPKFLQNSNLGSFYVRSCMVGRLLCDTFLSCRDILRENNYNLSFLAEKHLKEPLPELDTNILLSVSRPDTIIKDLTFLMDNLLREASLTMVLMDKLAILPLTKQLTNIAGNLWIKSLQNSRADRCEMFLMHEFNKNKYLLPDKYNRGGEKFEENLNEDKEDEPVPGKKKPQYAGGLVLEPKIGLYDSIVLLLDFNSLYPTIIQEFNICFTTVIRKPTQAFNYYEEKKKKFLKKKETNEGEADNIQEEEFDLDVKNSVITGKDKATLPLMLESLVQKRKVIKDLIKKEKDKLKLSMLDIKQKAIKLSANSLYGYLGYTNSRFYAKSIAALVTATGRNILQDTVHLVTSKHGLNIIYGDTDSIMINTGTQDINQALSFGNVVKNNIKEKYKLLEMEIDGVFKTLLLLRKKKYAYLKYEAPYSVNSKLTPEFKGLDLVRRDWCEISKQAGLHILDIILSDRSKEEIIGLIFDFLKDLGQKMDNDGFDISDYEITKQLTKNVDDYADAKALPHVKVAKRLKEKGDITIKQNAYIPYVICLDKENSPHSKALADKSYHPKEVQENPNLKLDITWYKENQIIASVSRLCKHIEEIDMFQLATQLGIDGSKYTYSKHKETSEPVVIMDQDEIVKCHAREGVTVICANCKKEKKINQIKDKSTNVISLFNCEDCKFVSKNYGSVINNYMMTVKKCLFRYNRSTKKCVKCGESKTRFFMKKKCNDPNCSNGTFRKEYSESETSNELNFLKKLLECRGEDTSNLQIKQDIQNNLKNFEQYVKDVNQKIEYNTIDLKNLFDFLKLN